MSAAALLMCAAPVGAQSLPNQVLALYPQQTGELAYVDATALRRSPHYAKLKAQVLPDRFRSLEQWTNVLGIEFEREVRQLSWAFVSADGGGTEFIGVAEGQFSIQEVEARARGMKLGITKPSGTTVISLGKNSEGSEFVFAFLDAATAVFGSRAAATEIITRRTQGGASVLDNAALKDQITQLNNSRSPVWFVLDRRYSGMAFKQMIPEASQVQGFDAVAARVTGSTLRFDLRNGLASQAAVRCQDASDCLLLSSAAQAAFAFQALRLRDTAPELARAFSDARINRNDTRVDMEFSVTESQFAALLAKNGLTLKF